MEQIARPGGPGGLFFLIRYMQYIPYVAIGLLVAAIVLWIIFARKKIRWTKILAIILTVLVVLSGILSFGPYIIGAITGRQIPFGTFPGNRQLNPEDREQFRDFRERQENNGQKSEVLPSVDFEDMVIVL